MADSKLPSVDYMWEQVYTKGANPVIYCSGSPPRFSERIVFALFVICIVNTVCTNLMSLKVNM